MTARFLYTGTRMRGMDRQPPRPMDPMEGNQMRVIFNEGLKAVADDLDHMARNVRDAIHGAGQALLNADLDAAQTVIDNDAETDELSTSIVNQCVELLARQNPVATDLRVVVSTMRLAITFERMGDLARRPPRHDARRPRHEGGRPDHP